MIYRNEESGLRTTLASSESVIVPGKLNIVTVERDNEHFTVRINGKTTLETTDLFPLSSDNATLLGLRSDGKNTVLKSLKVYRLALPEKASPLIAGDILLEKNHYTEAIEQYLTIAGNYKTGPITDAALAKA